MSKNPEIIILHETIWKSITTDVVTFTGLILTIGIGVILESSAMQWVGGLLFMLAIITRAARLRRVMNIAQARNRLDEIEAEVQP